MNSVPVVDLDRLRMTGLRAHRLDRPDYIPLRGS